MLNSVYRYPEVFVMNFEVSDVVIWDVMLFCLNNVCAQTLIVDAPATKNNLHRGLGEKYLNSYY